MGVMSRRTTQWHSMVLVAAIAVHHLAKGWTTIHHRPHRCCSCQHILRITSGDTVDEGSFASWALSKRQVSDLSTWATENGILMENGFHLAPSVNNKDDGETCDDWNVELSATAEESDRILHIPKHMIFSGIRVEQEIKDVEGFQDAVDYVARRKCKDQLPQFFLWIKVLQEFEKGRQSLWYPWIQSLPREFSNALYLDDVEMECLTPYAWSLAKLELLHLEVFQEALNRMPSVISEPSREDPDLARWALSVVFTRCWGEEKDTTGKYCHIAPVGDMLNHGDPAATFIDYDDEENCNIFLKHDVQAGSALSLSYGRTTNPSRFLVLYGFVDMNQSDIFSQILVTNPGQKHKDMGYDIFKMTFSTKDGSIAEEVFDVTLFSILEQKPELQQHFYDAHTRGDNEAAKALRRQYHLETCIMLKRHVDGKLAEVQSLLQKIRSLDGDNVIYQHPRLPIIFAHNRFMFETFAKVKARIDQMIQDEMKRRKCKEESV